MLVGEVAHFEQEILFVAKDRRIIARKKKSPAFNHTNAGFHGAELTCWYSSEHAIRPVAHSLV